MTPPIRRLLTLTTISACVLVLMAARADAATGGQAVRQAICDVFGSRCAYALRIAQCESNLNPRAVGGAGERGIFQVHPVHFRRFNAARLFDPLYNARAAFALSHGGRDWSPWTCRRYV